MIMNTIPHQCDDDEILEEYDFSSGVRGQYAGRFSAAGRGALEAAALFAAAMEWLHENYAAYRFFCERDIVWTIQTHLIQQIEQQNQRYRVYNDYSLLPGHRADLVIVGAADTVLLAAEFKYEPAHERQDIWPTRFPIVFWGSEGVGKDVQRVQAYVTSGKCPVAYAIFIDEGGAFRRRLPYPGSTWIDWDLPTPAHPRVAVLWTRAVAPTEMSNAVPASANGAA
jgi:hypothetical protein